MYNILFKCPFTAMICGATGSGKTTLIRNLIYYKDILFSSKLLIDKMFNQMQFYLKHFATLIEQNILKYSNHCSVA